MKKDKIIIKKGTTEISFDRSEIGVVNESHDGIVFQLKNGIMIHCTDDFMDMVVKGKIKTTIDKIPNGSVIVNLANYTTPVVVDTN